MQEEQNAETLGELRLAVATERQRHENLLNQRQPMAARAAELGELIDARRADIANYERRLEQQAIESETAESGAPGADGRTGGRGRERGRDCTGARRRV